MRSIFAKVLVWSLVTFALSLVAFWAIARTLERRLPPEGDPFLRMVSMVEEDAFRAYEEGGPGRLAEHLRRLDAKLPGEHHVTDARGLDLFSGADWSWALGRGGPGHGPPPTLPDGRLVLAGPPRAEPYRFVTVVEPWFEPPNILPYFGAVVLVILGMGAVLAAYLATPLRRLRRVVDRFGAGDHSARVGSGRRDEIGELSRSFDAMAGRIETLLAAERRLLQDVSHELRSPLARLGVAAELALGSDDPGPALGRIRRDIGRLSCLVDELLQLTRAEGDPAARGDEDVPLGELLRDLAEDCALEAQARGCRLALRVEGPGHVRGARELLRRAVENVVRNAVRHTPEGDAVEVALEGEGGRSRILVRDRGPGVPGDKLGAIFEPFYRVEGHRSRASGGVGLGLAIARRAVELHGGSIRAENARPGLVVTIELPASPATPRSP
jgi:two-component system sensor histidine kinase CpxA